MGLLVDNQLRNDHPTDLDITRSLSELAAGEHQIVALNNPATNTAVRVGRGNDGAFVLEVTDRQLNSTLRSAEHFLDSATVTDVFLSVLEGDDRWKNETRWVAVQNRPVRHKMSKWILLFIAMDMVITIIIIVVVVLTQGV